MNTIGLILDSSCGLNKKEVTDLGAYFVPLIINFDNQSYFDGVDITDEEFSNKLISATSISTASHSIGDLEAVWDTALKENKYIYHISISEKLSISNKIAFDLSNDPKYKDRVKVLEHSKFMSPWIAYWLNEKLIEYIKTLQTLEEADKLVNYLNNQMSGYISPWNLTYLAKGGRINPTKAKIGNFFKVVPIVPWRDGFLDDSHIEKARGFDNACEKIINKIVKEKKSLSKNHQIAFFYRGDEEGKQKVIGKIKKILNIKEEDIIWTRFANVVLAHIGPFAFGSGCIPKLEAIVKEI